MCHRCIKTSSICILLDDIEVCCKNLEVYHEWEINEIFKYTIKHFYKKYFMRHCLRKK